MEIIPTLKERTLKTNQTNEKPLARVFDIKERNESKQVFVRSINNKPVPLNHYFHEKLLILRQKSFNLFVSFFSEIVKDD